MGRSWKSTVTMSLAATIAVTLLAMALGYDRVGFPLRAKSSPRPNLDPETVAAGFGWSGAIARRAGTPACRERVDAAWADVDAAADEYRHPALRELHGLVRMTGTAYPALAECVLADLAKLLTFNLAREALPLQREITRDGARTELTVSEPAEPWARAMGYLYKGYVTTDGRPQLVLYWSGVGEATRGFLVQAPVGARGGAAYVLWERARSPQLVKVWLSEVGDEGLDRALYSELVFERASARVELKAISVEPQRGKLAGNGELGCFRVAATGRVGERFQIGRTASSRGETGHDPEAAFDDASELEWIETRDNRAAGEDGEILVGGRETRFPKTCRDLRDAVLPGAPFGLPDDVVDFFAGPPDVFGE